jgi:hypothetical protein
MPKQPFPIEDFVQSLSSQLDRARTPSPRLNGPTAHGALKDLSIQQKVFWEAQATGDS